MTPIAIPIFVRESAAALADMRTAVTAGATMIELRCDHATSAAITEVLAVRPTLTLANQSLPVIVTIRPTWEGGGYDGDESARHSMLLQAIRAGANLIDIELVAWQKSPTLRVHISELKKTRPFRLILSNHDFTGCPPDLLQRLAALREQKEADTLKLVWKATTILDAIEALRLTREQSVSADPRPLLALAMGEPGQISRLLGGKFGAPFTFATLPNSPGSAPGQPTIHDLLTTYRWPHQKPDTQVFGVIGHPVAHSLSPHIHNAGFDHLNFNGVYVPLLINPTYEAFAAGVDALRACPGMNLRGLSATIPHKENAIRYVCERAGTLDPLSAHIGVINTIIFSPPAAASLSPLSPATTVAGAPSAPALLGLNSDYPGALNALTAALTTPPSPALAGIPSHDNAPNSPSLSQHSASSIQHSSVAVLGAGGAARAIVAGLAHAGAITTIFNRSLPKALQLAAEFNSPTGPVTAAPLADLPLHPFDVYINCTPLGMFPHIHASPVPATMIFPPNAIVFDTIYNPYETQLLLHAKSQGAKIIPGLEMFVGQATIQFLHFTGQPAPTELFRQILLAHLLKS